jgi:LacI family transcriptional regulator
MKKVALLVETSRGYGRQILKGVAEYSQRYGPWSFYITPRDFYQELPRIDRWKGDGIIARTEDAAIVKSIVRSGLPAVMLDPPAKFKFSPTVKKRIIQVSPDPLKIVQMAVDHLLNQGFRHFAFCGFQGRVWSDPRQQNFVRTLRERDYSCTVYQPPERQISMRWETEQPFLSEWLKSLPKPVGIFACNDIRGRQVLDVCSLAQIAVPQDAAVLGVDNDDLFCELCNPPLSSIALNATKAGFELAGFLDQLMQSPHSAVPKYFSVEPLYVVERQSTDVLVTDDPLVAEALDFIRHEAVRPIGVADVANKIAVSRRSLEIRFRRAVGWSVHDELQRIRLNRVRRLLLETELTMEKISELSGFASSNYMAAAFRKQWTVTPLQYRKQKYTVSPNSG